ncbi:MAG: UDP-N-acetylmuramoyl-L-alanine--D-glutamate ligase [Ancrocorticia sp.]|uniref:UDP-N-acetylmuramoyl-L-alanine--D-glutamate ligase n=1 Tax=Ancrocorticia sp. TaxID=2593684 RepID=UPI003F915C9B
MVGQTVNIPGAQFFDHQRVAVVGLGISGVASLEVLAGATSATLSAWDSAPGPIEALDVPVDRAACIEDPDELAKEILAWQPDIAVLAPGIREVSPLFTTLESAGLALWSEIELAWHLRAAGDDGEYAPWLCVTGTNGKTTTVSMLAKILTQAGLRGLAIGNVGSPAVAEVSRTDSGAPGAFAVELSSFQLRTTHSVSPAGAVCLNIADDHLEWHGSREAYWQAKARVYEHTQAACVYPIGDSHVQAMVDGADVQEGARALGVTLGIPPVGAVGLVEDMAVDRAFGASRWDEGVELFSISDIEHLAPSGVSLPAHIVIDALMAATLARSVGVSPDAIREGLSGFQGGHHRIELIDTVAGVSYVDDSKATNAHAARASLMGCEDSSVVWIAGGQAKGSRFDELVAAVAGKLRAVIVIGKDHEPWRAALRDLSVPVEWINPETSQPMTEAVAAATRHAQPGSTVLLAPASASMDQFTSYAARGAAFAHEVRRIRG